MAFFRVFGTRSIRVSLKKALRADAYCIKEKKSDNEYKYCLLGKRKKNNWYG